MTALRVLFVEDIPSDAELSVHRLTAQQIPCTWRRVESESAFREALAQWGPELILSDFTLPTFDGLSALAIAHEVAPDVPFIFVSGTIGEERAINALQRGAVDYILKTNLARLVPAVKRALEDAKVKAARRMQESQIARLTRVLKMLSGINGSVLRIRDRRELLSEACRLATEVGGYAVATVALIESPSRLAQPVVWAGVTDEDVRHLSFATEESAYDGSIVDRVLRTAEEFVCDDVQTLKASAEVLAGLMRLQCRSVAVLPLIVDQTAVGTLTLASADVGVIGEEELLMLRELTANLSFALQYLQKEDKVRFLSYFDSLTGLAKRALFCERLDRLLDIQAARSGKPAVAVFDIERLSTINDSFGRHIGDLLLQSVADRIKRHFEDTHRIAQLGGGTFAVALDLSGEEDEILRRLQEHLTAIFAESFAVERHVIPVTTKAGFSRYPDNGVDANSLVQNAEAALNAAKTSGEKYLHHRLEMSSAVVSRLTMEHRLRGALEREEFELFYQPKVDVETQKIAGVEALLRWRNPDTGLVSPAGFLPLLESTGMIVPLGEWILHKAAADVQRWQRLGLPGLRVAVNISPVQLQRRAFVEQFLEVIGGWTSETCGLDIEVTEGVFLGDLSSIIGKLRLLRRKGVRIAIDDFGTGYSSLSRLSELPIDFLKVDRSFVTRMSTDPCGLTLVSTIVELGKAFNMTIIAEGVETPEQLAHLRRLGCHQFQGYLHSRPAPSHEIESMLADRSLVSLLGISANLN